MHPALRIADVNGLAFGYLPVNIIISGRMIHLSCQTGFSARNFWQKNDSLSGFYILKTELNYNRNHQLRPESNYFESADI